MATFWRKVALLAFVTLLVGACSSPQKTTKRRGLFDRLSEMDSSYRTSREKEGDEWGQKLSGLHVRKAVGRWQWPLKNVRITSEFGPRNGRAHEGIDFAAPNGTPIYAVQDGVTVYASSKMRGYGKLVILRHPSGLFSVYAHNSKMLVSPGKAVKKGQKIAISGSTGHTSGPHLHFEIRNQGVAIDPLKYYPKKLRAQLR